MKLPNLLNALSGVWYLLGSSAANIFLTEPRFSWRKTLFLYAGVMIPTFVFCLHYYGVYGSERGGQASLLIITLPTLILFFFLSKYRDGRPIFTYFFINCLSLEIILLTNIPNTYLTPETYYINFFGRLALYTLLCLWIWRRVREPFQYVLRNMKTGWGAFALLAALYYVEAVLLFNFPITITDRPAELPAMLLFLLLIPLTIWRLFDALRRQQELHESAEREQLLQMNVTMLNQRVEQTAQAETRLSIQRHDLRHRFRTLAAFLELGDVEAVRKYVASSDAALAETTPRRWCKNSVLDAVFAYYFGVAEAEGVRVEADLDFPDALPVDASELSTAFANALENALHAVKELPEGERVIRCKGIHDPQIMFRVSNPCKGEVRFDERGRPMAKGTGHGLGVRSIEAYCEKYGACCEFMLKDGWFVTQLVHL